MAPQVMKRVSRALAMCSCVRARTPNPEFGAVGSNGCRSGGHRPARAERRGSACAAGAQDRQRKVSFSLDIDHVNNSLWYAPAAPVLSSEGAPPTFPGPFGILGEAGGELSVETKAKEVKRASLGPSLSRRTGDGCSHPVPAGRSLAEASPKLGGAASGRTGVDGVFVDRRRAREVKQPADGSCLFHSLSYALNDGTTGLELRREISRHIEENPDMEIANLPLKDWVKLDCGRSIHRYAIKIAAGAEGGGIEMEVFSRLKSMNVHVYERCSGGYRRTCRFDGPGPGARGTAHVLYRKRRHYDALVLTSTTSPTWESL